MDLSKIREYGSLELLARQLVEGFITGLHKSPFHGFSVEFAEHRLYNTGESTRHIDWKVYGKTDRLYVKRFEEETNLRCHLLLDVSPSMYYPKEKGDPNKEKTKLYFACLGASILANLMQRQRDAVSLTTFSDEIEMQTAVKSTPGHIHQIYVELEKVLATDPKPKSTAVAETLHQLADQIHRRSLIIVFSDMFDKEQDSGDLFLALQHMKHNKHEVLLFHVTDKRTERNFLFEERPTEYIDLESGERVKGNPSEMRMGYKQGIEGFYDELRLKSGQYGIDFIEADINEGVDKIMSSFLVRRSKMK